MTDLIYQPFVSTAKNKKYSVYVLKDDQPRLIHFGDRRYQQFHDKIGVYAHLDHHDQKRREAYYKRHGPSDDINSAKFWSHHILW